MKRAAKALIRDSQGKILVLYRSETHPSLAHDIDLPGGLIEPLELVRSGLGREIFEETGVKLALKKSQLRDSWRFKSARRQYLFEATYSSSQPISISWEHESYAWLTDDEFVTHPAMCGFIRRAQEYVQQKA